MYIKTANFLSKISLKKKKKKKQKSTTIACEDQRALKDMLQNVQKLGHIPETWFVILRKKKKKKLSLWINLWRPSLVLLLKWLDVWMRLHSLESFCFCYLVMLMSLGTLQIIELMISFLQAPFKEL